MSATMAAANGKALDNTLALPLLGMAKTGQVEGKSVADGLWIMPIVAKAIDRCMSRKEAAILLGISEPTLSKQLAAVDGKCMNFARFGALGDAVAVALADELRMHFGLLDRAELITQAEALSDRARQLFARAAQR